MKPPNLTKNIKEGFTLIELLLVVSLLGITFGVTSDILISLVRNQVKTQVQNSLEQQANFVALKIEKDLRNAYSVTDNGTNKFIVNGRVNGVPYIVDYTHSGGVINRKESTFSAILPLTDTSLPGGVTVTCTGAGTICFSISGVSPTKITLSMRFTPSNLGTSAATPANTGFVDINTTFVVRGTY